MKKLNVKWRPESTVKTGARPAKPQEQGRFKHNN
jgi:hypothetical protein